MICRNCGAEHKDGQAFCPYCGMPAGNMPEQTKRPTSKTVWIVVLIALSAAVLFGTVAFIIGRVWSDKITTPEAYDTYKQILSDEEDAIREYEDENDVEPVAIYDINNSGVDDLIYAVRNSGSDNNDNKATAELHYAVDKGNDIVRFDPESAQHYILFVRKSDGALFVYTVDGDTEAFHHISVEDGRHLESFIRRHNEDGAYDYRYIRDGVEQDDNNTKRLEQFVDNMENDNAVVLLTDLPEEKTDDVLRGEKEIASTGFDDAQEHLDDNNKEETADTEKTEPPQVETGEGKDETVPGETKVTQRKAESVSVSELPEQESLKTFLDCFSVYSAYDGKTDKKRSVEYDCDKPDGGLVISMVAEPSCVKFSDYPGADKSRKAGEKIDPKRRFANGYLLYEKDKVTWILTNIFRVSDSDAKDIIAKAEKSGKVYEVVKGGNTYLCGPVTGKGGPVYTVSFEAARYDGEKYEVVYCHYYGPKKTEDSTVGYAEIALKEIDGKSYWTMYRHSDKLPDWYSEPATKSAETETREPTEAPKNTEAEDVFGTFAGEYIFSSGAGAWATQITLNSDGTFTGSFHDSDMGDSGPGYDSTLYSSEFVGTFGKAKKVNDYTYSFTLESISYEQEPGTEEIVTFDNGAKQRVIFSEAYGLDKGAKTIYAYIPDAPFSELPEEFCKWVSIGRQNKSSDTLDMKGLYVEEPQYGWMGPKD